MTTTTYTPKPGDLLMLPAQALRVLSNGMLGTDADAIDLELFATLDRLVEAGDPPLPAPDRAGRRVAAPTVEQLRLAHQALGASDDPAALVAHVVAEVLPYELGEWPRGAALTGLRCAAVYLVWRTQGRRDRMADLPGRWPHLSTADWSWAVARLRTTRHTAQRVEYVAWWLGTALDRLQLTSTDDHARQAAAASALFHAWRDELARAEQVRRATAHLTSIPALPVGGDE